MKILGVTGGVGAGKSTILSYLEEQYQAFLILADEVGHDLMQVGEPVYKEVVQEFGTEILTEKKEIDRKILGKVVFEDKEKLQRLNQIVHPAVKIEILNRIETQRKYGKALLVVEAALFLEENYDAFCDETWYIYTNEENREKRLMESRGYSKERVEQIMKSQKQHEEFLARCQYMIDNNGTKEQTHLQIDKRMKAK